MPIGPPITFRATPSPDHHTISPLTIWRLVLILKGLEIQILPSRNGLFSTGPPRWRGTWWMESGGLPPNTAKHPKMCEVNHLMPAHYTPKLPLFTPLRDKWPLYTHTYQIDFSRINLKKPQIITFIVFSIENFHVRVCKHLSCQSI